MLVRMESRGLGTMEGRLAMVPNVVGEAGVRVLWCLRVWSSYLWSKRWQGRVGRGRSNVGGVSKDRRVGAGFDSGGVTVGWVIIGADDGGTLWGWDMVRRGWVKFVLAAMELRQY